MKLKKDLVSNSVKKEIPVRKVIKKNEKEITIEKKRSSNIKKEIKKVDKPIKNSIKESKPRLTKEQKIEEKELLSRPISVIKEIPYNLKDSLNKEDEYIITLTSSGDIFVDPVPGACSSNIIRSFVASTPEIPVSDLFNFKAIMRIKEYEGMEVTSVMIENAKRINPFAEKFGLSKGTAGNIVFTLSNKGFNKKELSIYYNKIIEGLQREEIIEI